MQLDVEAAARSAVGDARRAARPEHARVRRRDPGGRGPPMEDPIRRMTSPAATTRATSRCRPSAAAAPCTPGSSPAASASTGSWSRWATSPRSGRPTASASRATGAPTSCPVYMRSPFDPAAIATASRLDELAARRRTAARAGRRLGPLRSRAPPTSSTRCRSSRSRPTFRPARSATAAAGSARQLRGGLRAALRRGRRLPGGRHRPDRRCALARRAGRVAPDARPPPSPAAAPRRASAAATSTGPSTREARPRRSTTAPRSPGATRSPGPRCSTSRTPPWSCAPASDLRRRARRQPRRSRWRTDR